MALHRDTETACGAVRYGRHGRPRPLGGRLRLPTIRFSGAAMAMSTVVGISLATTWLLTEQQQVGRRPSASVGASPPLPAPDAAPTGAQDVPAAHRSGDASAQPAPRRSVPPSALAPSVRPGEPAADRADRGSQPPLPPDGVLPDPSASPSSSPSPSGSPGPSTAPDPTGPGNGLAVQPPVPTPGPSGPAGSKGGQEALYGSVATEEIGSSGSRHTLELTVGEPMTALQVEFRLHRPRVLPGAAPWTDLPGAVATVVLERDALVYRFTVPATVEVPKGRYGFTVAGSRPCAAERGRRAGQESWTASAFALRTPRAVATRGSFPRPAAVPAGRR
ncbi:hypothetical protein [Kitasatospora camelliae]|uniref:Uncharacterized protein n=1 Tax=Kitasatospora camelliae TaxID=3156397 RepID=A0AAU8K157_9ACTN